jgi:hypothetical protein
VRSLGFQPEAGGAASSLPCILLSPLKWLESEVRTSRPRVETRGYAPAPPSGGCAYAKVGAYGGLG